MQSLIICLRMICLRISVAYICASIFHTNTNNTYLYISFSYRLPAQPSGEYCLSFAYHMYGEDIGALKAGLHLNGGKEKILWMVDGDQGNTWHTANVAITISGNEHVRAQSLL